jgi:cell division protein FtsQ
MSDTTTSLEPAREAVTVGELDRFAEVRRARGPVARWLLTVIATALPILLSAGCLLGWQRGSDARFQAVQSAGQRVLVEEALAIQAGLIPGIRMEAIDLEGVRRNLLCHPWISQAVVYRGLRGVLRIEVREREPAAILLAGQPLLVDGEGIVLGPMTEAGAVDLPVISGPNRSAEAGKQISDELLSALRLLEATPENSRPRISEVIADQTGELQLVLLPGPVVLSLGKTAPEQDLLRYLKYEDQIAGLDPYAVDLRYQGQIIARRRIGD